MKTSRETGRKRRTTKWALLAALVLTSAASAAAAADRYDIDAAHTFVNFTVPHLGISKARGGFRDVAGAINYDAKDVTRSSVEVTIKVASIDTGHEGRDRHLRSADFFDAEKFPEMTFRSKRVERRGAGGLVAVGDLTIKGVTKEVSMPFTLSGPIKDPFGGPSRLGAEASIRVDRRDYGITWGRLLETGVPFVGNEVTIDINLEASMPKPKEEK